MNILVSDEDPILSARCVPMNKRSDIIKDAIGMFGEISKENGGITPISQTTKKPFITSIPNHPCVRWLGRSSGNWDWFVSYITEIVGGKVPIHRDVLDSAHLSSRLRMLRHVMKHGTKPPFGSRTTFVACVPKRFSSKEKTDASTIEAYRSYIRGTYALSGVSEPWWYVQPNDSTILSVINDLENVSTLEDLKSICTRKVTSTVSINNYKIYWGSMLMALFRNPVLPIMWMDDNIEVLICIYKIRYICSHKYADRQSIVRDLKYTLVKYPAYIQDFINNELIVKKLT